jgi:hypothetical protein
LPKNSTITITKSFLVILSKVLKHNITRPKPHKIKYSHLVALKGKAKLAKKNENMQVHIVP